MPTKLTFSELVEKESTTNSNKRQLEAVHKIADMVIHAGIEVIEYDGFKIDNVKIDGKCITFMGEGKPVIQFDYSGDKEGICRILYNEAEAGCDRDMSDRGFAVTIDCFYSNGESKNKIYALAEQFSDTLERPYVSK